MVALQHRYSLNERQDASAGEGPIYYTEPGKGSGSLRASARAHTTLPYVAVLDTLANRDPLRSQRKMSPVTYHLTRDARVRIEDLLHEKLVIYHGVTAPTSTHAPR